MTLAPCRLPRGRVQSQAFTRSSLQRGNVYSAEDSHLRHMVATLLSSVAPPLLRRLDQTEHHLSHAGGAYRPCQKQVRTRGRKRTLASATDYTPSTGETACLYQDGPHASGSSCEGGSDLETSPVHNPARDVIAVASPGFAALLEVHIQSDCSQIRDICRDRGLDQGNGQRQPTVGSRADPRRIAQVRDTRL